MADIYQCPRCGAITYRHGITIHDRKHDEDERRMTKLEDQAGEAEGFELHNWPTDDEGSSLG